MVGLLLLFGVAYGLLLRLLLLLLLLLGPIRLFFALVLRLRSRPPLAGDSVPREGNGAVAATAGHAAAGLPVVGIAGAGSPGGPDDGYAAGVVAADPQ